MIGIASGSFQPVAACYGLLLVVSLVTIDDDLEICYKSTSCRFYYKVGQASLKSGDSFDVLQSRVSPITKGGGKGGGGGHFAIQTGGGGGGGGGSYFPLQIGASGIAK